MKQAQKVVIIFTLTAGLMLNAELIQRVFNNKQGQGQGTLKDKRIMNLTYKKNGNCFKILASNQCHINFAMS